MSANLRDCLIVPIRLASFTTTYQVGTALCVSCDEQDGSPSIPLEFQVFDQGEATKTISLAGLHMMHIVATDEIAACVKVSVRRKIRCRNCAKGCGTDEFYLDMGCLNSGHVFATGDYELTIEPQLNLANQNLDEVKLDIVFEPIIDEHIQAQLYNKC